MKYKLLGKSGLRVSEICLGTMTFGKDWEWGSTQKESRQVFDAYAEAGGNFLDTANMYTNGSSESLVGEFIHKDREKWVVATKYSLNNQNANVNTCGNHRKNMVQSLEGSLKRLKVEYIDLLWLHIWDSTTPIEEVMRAFDDLVRAGKVLYIGRSPAQVALNWIIQQGPSIIPIIGARHADQIKDNMACLDFTLSPKHLEALNKVSAITMGFPHDMINSELVQEFAFSNTLQSII